MEIKNLDLFVEAARRGSFVAVARERNVDPATISRAIVSLEEELKLKLFQRTTRRVELTQAGLLYFERVEPLVEELRQAQLMATELNRAPQGQLRISSPVSFAELNIVPLLPEFSLQYPDLSFDLLLTDADLDLIANQIDVAIRVGPLTDSRLISYKLCEMISHVCATPAYLEKNGRPETPAELAGHNALVLGYRGFERNQWRFRCKKSGKLKTVTVKEHLRTSNAMAMKICALAGMGITLQASWMIGRELRDGTLIDLFPDYEVTAALKDAAAWVLYPSRQYFPQKVRVFVDFLKTKFRAGDPWQTI